MELVFRVPSLERAERVELTERTEEGEKRAEHRQPCACTAVRKDGLDARY